MSKYKVEFTLKQHTPIIHFQSEQSGATLRATELKPKFDRFLLEQVSDLPIRKNANGHKSLDYKVKIKASNTQESKYMTYIPKRDKNNPLFKEGSYFGDNKSVHSNSINIEFFSFEEKIIRTIEKYFKEFISISSFGTRQNKGFGNFTDIAVTQNEFEEYLSKHFIIIKKIPSNEPLKKILSTYQNIKSGSRGGVKSKLMEYFLSKNIRWEKRWIKAKLKEKKPEWFNDLKDEYHIGENKFNFNPNEHYIFARALLGLSENSEFLVNSNSRDKLIVKVICNDDIERFASPIYIKVFQNSFYILLNKNQLIDRNILDKTFTFSAYYKSRKRDVQELGTLSTPTEFDIENFLKEALK